METKPQTLVELVDAAHQRGQQLEEGRLAATGPGQPAAMSDAGTARHAAELAELSRTRATAAHLDAATVHAVAARAYELAAEADPARADEHRRRAQWHHAEAAAARHHADQEQRP